MQGDNYRSADIILKYKSRKMDSWLGLEKLHLNRLLINIKILVS